jgi:hypothetical protein
MDSQNAGSPTQCAWDFCKCVGARAAEVGLLDGSILAKRHEGRVSSVNLGVSEPPAGRSEEPIAEVAPVPVGIAEAREILRHALEDALAEFVVRFGDVIMWFKNGSLCEVWITCKFRIDDEIPQLAWFFSPSPPKIARDEQRPSETGDSTGPKPR